MFQVMNEQLARQRARQHEPQGIRRRSLQVDLHVRRQERRRTVR